MGHYRRWGTTTILTLCVVTVSLSPVTAQPHALSRHSIFLPMIPFSVPPVQIVASSAGFFRQSPYSIYGSIRNATETPVSSVIITAHIYQADTLLGIFSTSTAFTATLPDLPNYFHIQTDIHISQPDRYELSVTSWDTTDPLDYRRVPVASQHQEGDGIRTRVFGELANPYSRPLHGIEAVIEPGTNSPYARVSLSQDTLAPGATIPYSIVILHPFEPAVPSFTIQAQGYLAP